MAPAELDANSLGAAALPGGLDLKAPLEIDVHCQRCAYNLRGLLVSGRCPECGAPVRVSLAGELLRFADPQWIGRLALGGKLVQVIVVVVALATIPSAWFAFRRWSYVLVPMAVIATALLVLPVGVWLLTTPSPRLREFERWYCPRRTVRAISVVNLASVVASVVLYWVQRKPDEWMWLQAAAGPLGLVGLFGILFFGSYARSLALRLEDDRTAACASSYTVGAVFGWLACALGIAAAPALGPVSLLLLAPGAPLLLILMVLTLSLPARLVPQLIRFRNEAELNWQLVSEQAPVPTHPARKSP